MGAIQTHCHAGAWERARTPACDAPLAGKLNGGIVSEWVNETASPCAAASNERVAAMTEPASRLMRERLALLPATADADPTRYSAALTDGGAELLDLITATDLAPLWHHSLQSGGLLESLPCGARERLREARLSSAMGYLVQRAALDRVDGLFEAQDIPYAVIKGAHVRECVYPDPALRPASDIDILISPSDRRRAARALIGAGYEPHPEPANVSHEATFSQGPVDIDLHWDMLRPGRTRVEMTRDFLARRQRTNGQWGLSDTDTLFMMLTHPAFAKYVCSPNMGLVRVADFLLWLHERPVDWPAVRQLLKGAGLKTAAWTMLSWFGLLAAPGDQSEITSWTGSVRPGRLRAAYLRTWLSRDLPTRWLNHPLLIQIGFTLPLHDRPSDALHAVDGWRRSRRNRSRDVRLLLGDEHYT
jgi:hypothetical protein